MRASMALYRQNALPTGERQAIFLRETEPRAARSERPLLVLNSRPAGAAWGCQRPASLHRTPTSLPLVGAGRRFVRRVGCRARHAASGFGISEMQQFNIQAFHIITTWFQNLKTSLRAHGKDKHEETPEGGVIIRYVDDPVMAQLLPQNLRELQSSLRQLATKLTAKTAHRLVQASSAKFTYPEIITLVDNIYSRLNDELEDIIVLVLSPEEQGYYQLNEPLFGKDFETNFPSAAFEVDEAAKCMAFARYTAAIFHLMRCMEIGVRTVAKSLGKPDPIGHDRNWFMMLRSIKDAMNAKTKTGSWQAEDKEIFESAYASLDATRVAWRNTTMHIENKYTGEEALDADPVSCAHRVALASEQETRVARCSWESTSHAYVLQQNPEKFQM
jgi:hypothetical protein